MKDYHGIYIYSQGLYNQLYLKYIVYLMTKIRDKSIYI